METRAGLLRYGFLTLAWIAGVEWLLGRAVSRLAASPVLDGPSRTIIEFLGSVGLFLLAPATLLAVALLLLSIFIVGSDALASGDGPSLALAIYFGLFAVISAAFVLMPRALWLDASYGVLSLFAFWGIALKYAVLIVEPVALRIGVLFVTCAYTGYLCNLLLQVLGPVGLAPGVSPIVIRDLGEAFLVAVPFAFFAALAVPFRQCLKPGRWILPLILTLIFSMANVADMVADQGFTGVFAIWSIGLSYYLPWPLYAISLVLYVYSILICLSSDRDKSKFATKDRAIGLLLLTFASYELQFPYQYILALLSLMLLSGIITPFATGSQVAVGFDGALDETTFARQVDSGSHTQPSPPGITT